MVKLSKSLQVNNTVDTIFLTLEQLLVIHEDQLERYGGSSGIRELSLIESALFRPQSTFSGEDLYHSLFDKAAAFMHSLLKNHAFVDGNKRTATVATIMFLDLNGQKLQVGQKSLVNFALSVENESTSLEDIASWLDKNCKKAKGV